MKFMKFMKFIEIISKLNFNIYINYNNNQDQNYLSFKKVTLLSVNTANRWNNHVRVKEYRKYAFDKHIRIII